MVVLLHYRVIIVLFAGERIFKIDTLLAKLQAKSVRLSLFSDNNVSQGSVATFVGMVGYLM